MNNLLRNFNVGLIGDSHLTRMAPFMQPQVRIIGRGGERASNYARYLQEVRQLDILLIFIGGNDITGKNGSPASSKLKDLVHDIKSLFSYASSYGVMVLTCDQQKAAEKIQAQAYCSERLLQLPNATRHGAPRKL